MPLKKILPLKRIFNFFIITIILTNAAHVWAQSEESFDDSAFWSNSGQGVTPSIAWPQLEKENAPVSNQNSAPPRYNYNNSALKFPDYQLPAKATLCGEELPIHNRFVRERLEYEFIQVVHNRAQVRLWMRRGARYFPLIEARLKAAGLPADLKYLAVAESDLRPSAVSPSGALGIWQFMPGTATKFGLNVDQNHDERHLPEPLLDIGIKYLSQLHNQFGSWPLAMAGYNCGEGCVGRNLKKQSAADYYNLNLPRETERYIYRIAAIKIIMEDPQAYGFDYQMPPSWRMMPKYDETTAAFPQPVSWKRLAELTSCDYKTIRRLNPHLSGGSLTGGPVRLRVPEGQAQILAQKLLKNQ